MPPPEILIKILTLIGVPAFIFWVILGQLSPPKSGERTNRPDKDPKDYTLSPSSTPWEKQDYCPHCQSPVGHNEWLARICESCGSVVFSPGDWSRGAHRMIVRGGCWVKQRRIENIDYLIKDGKAEKL